MNVFLKAYLFYLQVIYGLRGWIAFVSFLDLGTAVQCFIDTDDYLTSLYTANGVAEHSKCLKMHNEKEVFMHRY